jgi:hypothetical protein
MPLHLRRTVATAEARIVDGEGRLVAHATTAATSGRQVARQRHRRELPSRRCIDFPFDLRLRSTSPSWAAGRSSPTR